MKFRPIFWTGAADCVADFFIHNRYLQNIANQHPLYILYSGERDYLDQYYPNAICEPCENVWQAKAIKLFNILKTRDDFDVLIRFCPDAMIKNVDKLFNSIENGMTDEKTVLGNKEQNLGFTYLRGGCNATPKALVHKMKFQSLEEGYDYWYSILLEEAGGVLKNWPLFEINNKYTGEFPVWHPRQNFEAGKEDYPIRLKYFIRESENNKN